VVGDVAGDSALETIALCNAVGTVPATLVVAPMIPSMSNNLLTTYSAPTSPMKLSFGRARVSLPTLADVDGDGKKEIVVLTQADATSDLVIKVWAPDATGTASVTSIR